MASSDPLVLGLEREIVQRLAFPAPDATRRSPTEVWRPTSGRTAGAPACHATPLGPGAPRWPDSLRALLLHRRALCAESIGPPPRRAPFLSPQAPPGNALTPTRVDDLALKFAAFQAEVSRRVLKLEGEVADLQMQLAAVHAQAAHNPHPPLPRDLGRVLTPATSPFLMPSFSQQTLAGLHVSPPPPLADADTRSRARPPSPPPPPPPQPTGAFSLPLARPPVAPASIQEIDLRGEVVPLPDEVVVSTRLLMRNGVIRAENIAIGGGFALRVVEGGSLVLENVEVHRSGIHVSPGGALEMRSCAVRDAPQSAVCAMGEGAVALIRGGVIENAGRHGIVCEGGARAEADGVDIRSPRSCGAIALREGSELVLRGGRIGDAKRSGVLCQFGAR